MKASSCAAMIWSLSLLLSTLGLLASCSLETTGSGDVSLSPDDDDSSSDDNPDTTDRQAPGDKDDDPPGTGNLDGGPSKPRKDADAEDDATDHGDDNRNDNCRPGNYEGSYVCKQPPVTTPPWAFGFGGNQVSGSFTFRLTPTGKPSAFELTGGTLHSEQIAFFKLDATITATLTCGRPLKGKLTNASYTNILGTTTPFESPFDATFDETTGSFQDGTWIVSDANGTVCDGTWTATRTD
ncbi:MAG: hypothetical protein RLZZ450_1586 [Pseudomonadota bacterium]